MQKNLFRASEKISFYSKNQRTTGYARGNLLYAIVGIIVVIAGVMLFKTSVPKSEVTKTESLEYNPQINPSEFSTNITNKYFTLPVGKKMIYEADTEEGVERIEIEIEKATKNILGVETIIYRDKVYLDGVLVEDTKDYLAQDKQGNVWYFGEEVNNYESGKLKDHAGSFIAGIDGAKPGIWLKGDQVVGDSYKQEYYKGEAEDMRDVIAIGLTVTTKLATYTNCVKVYDWTPLDPKSREHKYYCPEAGALVLNENLEDGKRAELVKVTTP